MERRSLLPRCDVLGAHGGRARRRTLEHALDVIEKQPCRMARLTGNLLDLSRVQSGTLGLEMTDTNLRELVDGLLAP
jgi:K+-sensing histidine kinase KdpD